MRIAIYTRVSTKDQTTENQLQVLKQWAARAGHEVARVFEDKGISGAKGRDKRPAFDAVLRGAVRREFEMVAVWSTDRLGRSLPDLIEVMRTLQSVNCGLYIATQGLDTSTPSGRAMYQMLGVFSELERELIVSRVNAGLDRARAAGTKLGRRPISADIRDAIAAGLSAGRSVRQVAAETGASVGTVGGISAAMRDSL